MLTIEKYWEICDQPCPGKTKNITSNRAGIARGVVRAVRLHGAGPPSGATDPEFRSGPCLVTASCLVSAPGVWPEGEADGDVLPSSKASQYSKCVRPAIQEKAAASANAAAANVWNHLDRGFEVHGCAAAPWHFLTCAGLHCLGFPFSSSGFLQVCFDVGMTVLLGVAASESAE
jgi:hypothetical protein